MRKIFVQCSYDRQVKFQVWILPVGFLIQKILLENGFPGIFSHVMTVAFLETALNLSAVETISIVLSDEIFLISILLLFVQNHVTVLM